MSVLAKLIELTKGLTLREILAVLCAVFQDGHFAKPITRDFLNSLDVDLPEADKAFIAALKTPLRILCCFMPQVARVLGTDPKTGKPLMSDTDVDNKLTLLAKVLAAFSEKTSITITVRGVLALKGDGLNGARVLVVDLDDPTLSQNTPAYISLYTPDPTINGMKVPGAVAAYFTAPPETQVTLGDFTPVSGTTTSTMEFVSPTEADSRDDLAVRDIGLIGLTSETPTAEGFRAFLADAAAHWAKKAKNRQDRLALPKGVDPKSPEGIEAANAAPEADRIDFHERARTVFLSLAGSAPSNSAASNSASSS